MTNQKPLFTKWAWLWLLPPYWLWKAYVVLHKAIRGSIKETATVNHPIIKNNGNQKHFAIIGCGLSGIQALKECYAQGHEATCMDQAGGIGGLWRYRTATDLASVYRSTHIDTGRDINSFGDTPIGSDKPIVLQNKDVAEYLRNNIKQFNLDKKIRLRTKVTKITPYQFNESTKRWQWRVESESLPNDFDTGGDADPTITEQQAVIKRSEVFDGVLICTGRHSQPVIPNINGREQFKGFQIHSAYYKSPETHDLKDKTVVVVGVGNSGSDIATELGPLAKKVYLVSRSGSWVCDLKRKPVNSLGGAGDRLFMTCMSRLPWKWYDQAIRDLFSTGIIGDQALLDDAGLKPNHGPMQTLITVTGLIPDTSLHNEVGKQHILIRHDITKITATGIYFDSEEAETPVDAIIWATGYRQAVDCLDPCVVDLRYSRDDDNQVTLYKMMWPVSEYQNSIAFINYVQGFSFAAADLQTRAFFQVFEGSRQLPDLITQRAETEALRMAMSEQYVNRPRNHIQAGLSLKYYDDLAKFIGCYPSISKMVCERPSALWHAWFTPIIAVNYRLVGPGQMQNAEEKIAEREEALEDKRLLQEKSYLFKLLQLMVALVFARFQGYYIGDKQYQPDVMRKLLMKSKK